MITCNTTLYGIPVSIDYDCDGDDECEAHGMSVRKGIMWFDIDMNDLTKAECERVQEVIEADILRHREDRAVERAGL